MGLKNSMREFMDNYTECTNTNDVEKVCSLVHPDATFHFSDGIFVGINEFKNYLKNNFETYRNQRYNISNLDWIFYTHEIAGCRYEYNCTYDVNGKKEFSKGKGTSIIISTPEGWRLYHEHLSR